MCERTVVWRQVRLIGDARAKCKQRCWASGLTLWAKLRVSETRDQLEAVGTETVTEARNGHLGRGRRVDPLRTTRDDSRGKELSQQSHSRFKRVTVRHVHCAMQPQRPLQFHRRGLKMRFYGNEPEGSHWSQQMQQTPSRDLVEKRETGECLRRDIRVEGMSGRIFKLP